MWAWGQCRICAGTRVEWDMHDIKGRCSHCKGRGSLLFPAINGIPITPNHAKYQEAFLATFNKELFLTFIPTDTFLAHQWRQRQKDTPPEQLDAALRATFNEAMENSTMRRCWAEHCLENWDKLTKGDGS